MFETTQDVIKLVSVISVAVAFAMVIGLAPGILRELEEKLHERDAVLRLLSLYKH